MIKLGFEIEACHHPSLYIRKGDYHKGRRVSQYWKAERDGSIKHYENDSAYESYNEEIELVSYIIGIKSYKKALHELKTEVFKNKSFKDVLHINNSCGAHIHFSVGKNNQERNTFKRMFSPYFEKSIKHIFFKNLNDASNIPEWLKEQIKRQYYRSYAPPIEKRVEGRYLSLNFEHKNTIEWRSFNTLGVGTWETLFILYDIAVKTIIEFVHTKIHTFELEYKTIEATPSLNVQEVYISV